MLFHLCKLKPKGPIHLGERENFLETTETFIHSDTFFSAFCHSYLLLYGKRELENLLENFLKMEFPFKITSLFPYIEEKFYFPIPENQMPKEKKLKKKLFIEKIAFEEIISGKPLDSIDSNSFIPDSNGNFPFEVIHTPRVSLGRLNSSPGENFFHFAQVFYKDKSGFFFLYEVNKEFEKRFKATINLISEEGIGGDRTIGKGFFHFPEFLEIDINIPKSSNSYFLLSNIIPQKDEIPELKNSFYQIIKKKNL